MTLKITTEEYWNMHDDIIVQVYEDIMQNQKWQWEDESWNIHFDLNKLEEVINNMYYDRDRIYKL